VPEAPLSQGSRVRPDMSRGINSYLLLALIFGLCTLGFAQQGLATTAKTVAEELSYSKNTRLLLIQAEDLGMAHSIDKATFEALEKGWVTTAGVLVPGPWFPEVLRWARQHPNNDLGIRLDLNSDWSSYRWRPVSPLPRESGLTDAGGYLSSSYQYVAAHATPADVEGEVRAQIDLAKRTGVAFTHLDSHMLTMMVTPALFRVYWRMGQEFGVPIMVPNQQLKTRGTKSSKPGFYNFAGLEIDSTALPVDRMLEIKPGLTRKDWMNAYKETLEKLPPGVYLLSVHLGFNDDELQAMTWDHPDWGAQWRQNDYDVVSSDEFHRFLKDQGFVLINWRDLRKVIPQSGKQKP
jgi:chitin disaccharide deacetylase